MRLYLVNRSDFDDAIIDALENIESIQIGGTGYVFPFDDLTSPLEPIAESDAVAYRQRDIIRPKDAFELGIAAAEKRPTLVFSDKHQPPLAIALPQIQYATSISSFLYAIDQLNAASQRVHRDRTKPRRISNEQRRLAKQFLSYNDWWSIAPQDYERRVLELLRATSPKSLARRLNDETTFDFAIWDSKLESSVGNPVMIEAKVTCTSQIFDEIRLKSSKLGPTYSKALVVLLYLDGIVPQREREDLMPRVVAINAVALAQDLMQITFADALRRAIQLQSGR